MPVVSLSCQQAIREQKAKSQFPLKYRMFSSGARTETWHFNLWWTCSCCHQQEAPKPSSKRKGSCDRCAVGDISAAHTSDRTGPGRSSIFYSQSLEVNEIFINKLKFSWQARSCSTTKSCQPQLSDSKKAGLCHSLFTERSQEELCSMIFLSLRIN